MTKRVITPKAKPGELKAAWGRVDRHSNPSICYVWGGDGAGSPDARILSNALEGVDVHLGKTFAQELVNRGYDLTTLRFTIQRATDQ